MFKNITLEVSLKPFKSTDDKSIKEVCERIFDDWAPLLSGRECISVMLWCADGSEILDYAGKESDEFEWCKYLGTANREHIGKDEPLETSLHKKKQFYTENPPKMTYGILKNIVRTLKETGKTHYPNAKIRVGETFDIGPEFAVSTFKYERHPEICTSTSGVDNIGFVDSTSLLHADNRSYAAYPNGIPEGEPFGLFLGKQSDIFLKDMGFDYIWLSNGLGFSADPWIVTGKVFDGKRFYPEKLEKTAESVFKFWKLFREGCPDFLIETRGTNNSVGIDYSSDGVPLYDIYNADLNIIAPPNSPWAAINRNYGLEIAGHMTRCCELPNDIFPFRFYLHDPWWVNSPWYDRYEGVPTDIYIPMAISRIDKEGKVKAANALNILSIDNSYGDMPKSCVYEPLPHFLKAEKESPDEIAPLVWIYPMREYTTSKSEDMLSEMHFGDKFICSAINDGLPLCTVASADLFLNHDLSIYKASVLICPAKISDDVLIKLNIFAQNGGSVILYGGKDAIEQAKVFASEKNVRTTDTANGTKDLFSSLSNFGYKFEYIKKKDNAKSPVISLSRYDGAFMFSSYNPNASTDAMFSMPLGAPLMIGAEVEIKGNTATYRLPKFTHAECRIFITQDGGVAECHEISPVSRRFRRKIKLSGLENANICFFPEIGVSDIMISDMSKHDPIDGTPIAEDGLLISVNDPIYGNYYAAKGLTGEYIISMGYKEFR